MYATNGRVKVHGEGETVNAWTADDRKKRERGTDLSVRQFVKALLQILAASSRASVFSSRLCASRSAWTDRRYKIT